MSAGWITYSDFHTLGVFLHRIIFHRKKEKKISFTRLLINQFITTVKLARLVQKPFPVSPALVLLIWVFEIGCSDSAQRSVEPGAVDGWSICICGRTCLQAGGVKLGTRNKTAAVWCINARVCLSRDCEETSILSAPQIQWCRRSKTQRRV